MINLGHVNLLAVFLAGASSMVVGFVWYGPIFGKTWIKLMGYKKEDFAKDQKNSNMSKIYMFSFLGSLVTAYVLAFFMSSSRDIITALFVGFLIWVGFIAPVQMTEVLFGGKKWELYAINTGYQLVSLLVMAVILSVI